ncbi:MAG: prenyltransferase/squalene oxidase repeat-containing protein [Limisphaerales bacterium]
MPASAADRATPVVVAFQPDRVDEAIDKGVNFLISLRTVNGVIHEGSGESHNLAHTALSVMALAAVGHMPGDDTREGKAMDQALGFILSPKENIRNNPTGYFGGRDGSRMYGHGIVTLLLTEMLGMGKNKNQDLLIRDGATKGIKVILDSQRVNKGMGKFMGGWRYYPHSKDSDLSVTVWQLMALRSANNAGLSVPRQSISAAVEYLRRSYYSNRDPRSGQPVLRVSGFGYQPGSRPTFAMTSAGLLALQVVGGHNLPEVQGAGQWLLNYKIAYDSDYLFYGGYYMAQGMKKLGGEFATNTRQRMEQLLLDNQSEDGSWTAGNDEEKNKKRVYATSLAILALSVKHGFLPIYQD